MVPPQIFVSGGIAVLHLCKEIYVKYQSVKRYRDDCKKLCYFVHRVEGFLMETEEDTDMTQPGWQAAFTALHESLLEVGQVFSDCARFGIVRSIINADEINLRLSSIAQRMTMALQLIPIQKAKATDRRLAELYELQTEIRTAQFVAARAAEQQSAKLKRLMDQSRLDASKTHDMIAQVLSLLQQDQQQRTAAAAAISPDHNPDRDPRFPDPPDQIGIVTDPDQIASEVYDLREELLIAHKQKKIIEEQYLAQIIAAIEAMELSSPPEQPAAAAAQQPAAAVPPDLLCPITYQLLEDPVMLVDSGQTYERAAIEEWLSRGNTKDPVTGVQLCCTTLVPNVLVKKLAREWLEHHPEYRAQLAAAAAAAAQHDACLPAAFVLQRSHTRNDQDDAGASSSSKAAAAAAAAHDDQDAFELDPKAAALLASLEAQAAASAATAGSGSKSSKGSSFDPAVFSLNKQQQQQQEVSDEKAAANRAYAAAVAAAAAQEAAAATAAVAPAMRAAPSTGLAIVPPGSSSSSNSSGSNAVYSSGLLSAPAGGAAAAGSSAGGGSRYVSGFSMNSRRSSVDAAVLQQQQQQISSSSSRSLQQQQSGTSGRRNSTGGSAAAASLAAAAAAGDGITLDHFRATFGRMQTVRHEITMKHGNKLERILEQERQERQQQQQRLLEQQELQQQIDRYKQQYQLQLQNGDADFEDIAQAAAAGAGLGSISAAPASVTAYQPPVRPVAAAAAAGQQQSLTAGSSSAAISAPSNLALRADSATAASSSRVGSLPLQGYQSLPVMQQQPHAAAAAASLPPAHSTPPNNITGRTAAAAAAAANHISSSSSKPPAGPTNHHNSSNSNAGHKGSKPISKGLGFGLGKKSKTPKDHADVDADDASSVTSDGSSTNAPRNRRGVMGLLKNMSYTMVYQDDKC